MEHISGIITWVTTNWTNLGIGVLAVLGGFSVLAKITPTEADDKVVNFLLNLVHKIGLTKGSSN